MDRLSDFLHGEARRPFGWPTANCLLLPADWLVALGHPDPAGSLRGVTDTEASAEAVLSHHGGAVGLMTAGAAAVGLAEVTNAVRGDVGAVIVTGPDGRAEVGAICTGHRWAVRGRRGLWIGRAVPLKAWRVKEV